MLLTSSLLSSLSAYAASLNKEENIHFSARRTCRKLKTKLGYGYIKRVNKRGDVLSENTWALHLPSSGFSGYSPIDPRNFTSASWSAANGTDMMFVSDEGHALPPKGSGPPSTRRAYRLAQLTRGKIMTSAVDSTSIIAVSISGVRYLD